MISIEKNTPDFLKVKWGASLEELIASDPNTINKNIEPGDYLSLVGLARIENYRILDQFFEVNFIFDKIYKRLCRINIVKQYSDYDSPGFPAISGAFQMISMLLSSKYGHPEKDDVSSSLRSLDWKLKDVHIILSTLEIEGLMSQLTISYVANSVFSDQTFGL